MKRKTWTFPPACKQGHPYGPDPLRDERGSRLCLECRTQARLCTHCKLRPVTRKRAAYCSKACSNAARGVPLADRFLLYYRPGAPYACWPWAGAVDRVGYGVISDENRKQIRAHRIAYERTHGPIPADKHVCHICDNPPCCNPAHLFVGSSEDNRQDMVSKGRQCHGSRHPRAKLSEADVRAIKTQPSTAIATLAHAYGVSRATIAFIRAGRTWMHVS